MTKTEKAKYRVKKGEVIGLSGGACYEWKDGKDCNDTSEPKCLRGDTGRGNSCGSHLHYELGTEDAFNFHWWNTTSSTGYNPFTKSKTDGPEDGSEAKKLRTLYANIDPKYVLTETGKCHACKQGSDIPPDLPTFPPFSATGGWNSNPNSDGYKSRDESTMLDVNKSVGLVPELMTQEQQESFYESQGIDENMLDTDISDEEQGAINDWLNDLYGPNNNNGNDNPDQ
jgi:hypothetical protein